MNERIKKELEKTNAVKGTCHILGGKNFVLDYNGDILPCTHFTGFPMFNIFSNGKIMSIEKFLEEYNNPQSIGNRFREKLRYYPSDRCYGC